MIKGYIYYFNSFIHIQFLYKFYHENILIRFKNHMATYKFEKCSNYLIFFIQLMMF